METKKLILHLLQQDLKYHQLTENLRHIGLDDDGRYSLDLMPLIAELMEVPDSLRDKWCEIYVSLMEDVWNIPIEGGMNLCSDIAEKCFGKLRVLINQSR